MSTAEPSAEAVQAREWLDSVAGLRRRTRTARQGFWLPLLLLGCVVLVATPLYFQPSDAAQLGLPPTVVFHRRPASLPLSPAQPGKASQVLDGRSYVLPVCRSDHGVVYTPCSSTIRVRKFSYFPGGLFTESPRAISLYWLIALTLAYLVIGWWYRWRARRHGVATSPIAYVATGLCLLAFLVLTSQGVLSLLRIAATFSPPGDLMVRGLAALLAIALGLLVLAYRERSVGLGVYTLLFVALAFVVNLYDVENLTTRMGLSFGPEVGVFVAGLYLVGGGVAFAFVHRRAR